MLLQRMRISSVLFIFCLIHLSALPPGGDKTAPAKVSELGVYKGYAEPVYKGFSYSSQYLTMRDGVKLAADIFLPAKRKENEQFPTIIYLTRYVRSLQAKFPFNLLKNPVLVVVPESEIEYFTSYGYACVIVDVRGSGASFGSRTMEFSPAEVKDGSEIVDWIISQPWSNGKVASTGVSYVGTTAELLLTNKHPAVKACIPRSNIFDLYNHMMFPNGVRQGPFIKVWGLTTQALDGNNFDIFGKRAERLLKGIHPVENDRKDAQLKQALASRTANFNVYEGLFHVNFRDDKQPETELCSNDYSIHANRKAVEESGAAIYRIDGWYDGALSKSVIEGYLNTSNTERVLLGPWDHGPHDNASPFSDTKEVTFDVKAEMLRFFDHYVKGIDNGINREKKINYFTVGEEEWKSSESWPPLPEHASVTYYFSADKKLVTDSATLQKGTVEYIIDYTATSGNSSRWNSQTPTYKNGPTNYPDRTEVSARLLNFTTQPFSAAVELTGHVIADLYISADATDADVYCYVEDVAPDGSVTYVTEGLFCALNRKVSNPDGYKQIGPYHSFRKEDAQPLTPGEPARLQFDLLPISYLFKEGHALRLSIAGGDTAHFDSPDEKPSLLTVSCGMLPSNISVPLAPREKKSN